jgi:predicted small integral membrane protein
MLGWMAWTWPTALFFVALFAAMAIITLIEIRRPGTSERRGVLGLTTTRGDRLFLSLLGAAYIFLAWLGFYGNPLWVPLGLSVAWGAFCFWKV